MKYGTKGIVDVSSTAEAIHNMAQILSDYSMQVSRIATKMEETKDISYAGEALNCVANCISNLRIDLLATRPVRAYDRAIIYANMISE